MEDALTKTLAIGRPISYSLPTNEYRKRQLAIKQSLIDEAVSWPGDTEEGKFIFTEVWSGYGYSVKFGKYGKEYYRINRRNVNDMMPAVFKDGNINLLVTSTDTHLLAMPSDTCKKLSANTKTCQSKFSCTTSTL